MAPGSTAPNSRRAERRFFTGMALGILVLALAGFARTYFLRPLLAIPTPTPPALTPLIHLHGWLRIAGWMAERVK